ncbi:X-box-binding protein 1-like [Pomacea canaliculata]|uniref:X-box-binding protein 1-like n=1 Tax=Pomacea canaliculata TaxID=400727 RepID=UPI000D72FDBD|nr:X-box-binding protein 1-like [Pomacea canaliculata]
MSLLPPKAIVITAFGTKNVNSFAMSDIEEVFTDGGGQPRKRKRLTHLSADEKILRRKLKNRVAAQTARDRKKALMVELEEKVAQLQEQNRQLMKENAELRVSRSSLQQENCRLKKSLNSPVTTPPANTAASGNRITSTDASSLFCKTEPDSPGSAVPAVSLPKEQIQALSRLMMHYAACALTMSLMLCLVCYNSSLQKVEGSSRKRKQTRPARRSSQNTVALEPTLERCHKTQDWWGPQQQSWNPSMN